MIISPTVKIPPNFDILIEAADELPTTEFQVKSAIPHTSYIQSNDRDVSLLQLQKTNPNALIIDVSELQSTDLLKKINGEFNHDTLEFQFSESEKLLLMALLENKTVILHGNIPNEIVQLLTPLLIERMYAKNPGGKIVFVSDQENPFPHLMPHYKHLVTMTEKKALLSKTTLSDADIEKNNFAQLRAMQHATNPWIGMKTLPPVQFLKQSIHLLAAKEIADQFNQARLIAVNTVLSHSPYVFLAGMTGVGKTTFVEKFLIDKNRRLFREQELREWASPRTEESILFIDEATLTQKQWSQFEGLFFTPKSIVIDGEYILLSDKHKIVFAGNPASYSDDRSLPKLFQRHGNAVLFDPFPAETIYHDILEPLFKKTRLVNLSQEISLPILKIYQFLAERSNQSMLITPRELSMIAMLTLSYCKKNPSVNPVEVAQHYAFSLCEQFVPLSSKEDFTQQFKIEWQPPEKILLKKDSTFYLTKNNESSARMLADFLLLREFRRTEPHLSHEQLSAGLGGIAFEGEPGIGKSRLAIEILLSSGFEKGNIHSEISDENLFYHIEPSWSLANKKMALIKAFYEGNPVIWDEINCSSSLEAFLNDLLMGKIPDDEAIKLQIAEYNALNLTPKSGFILIGTQNPTTMAGRRKTSDALHHRIHYRQLENHAPDELIHIIVQMGVPEKRAEKQVIEFLEKQKADGKLSVRNLFHDAKIYQHALISEKTEPLRLPYDIHRLFQPVITLPLKAPVLSILETMLETYDTFKKATKSQTIRDLIQAVSTSKSTPEMFAAIKVTRESLGRSRIRNALDVLIKQIITTPPALDLEPIMACIGKKIDPDKTRTFC